MNFKQEITRFIDEGNYEKIIELGQENLAQTLRYVQMHIWGDDHLPMRWHAIVALNRLTVVYGAANDEMFRNLIRRCLWAMNDESGNVPWAAPEVMAAVIKGQPQQFVEFIPMLMTNSLENPICHRGMLWAVGFLGQAFYDELAQFLPPARLMINDTDAALRGYAVWAFGEIDDITMKTNINALSSDTSELMFYHDGIIDKVSVAQIVSLYV